MWSILFSAVNTLLGFVFRSLIVKFVTFLLFITLLLSLLVIYLQNASGIYLSSAFGGLTPVSGILLICALLTLDFLPLLLRGFFVLLFAESLLSVEVFFYANQCLYWSHGLGQKF